MTYSSDVKDGDEKHIVYRSCPGIVLTSSGRHVYLVTSFLTIELNESAIFYWKLMEKGASSEDLMREASTRYDIDDPVLLRKDIDGFIRLCLQHLLIIKNGDE